MMSRLIHTLVISFIVDGDFLVSKSTVFVPVSLFGIAYQSSYVLRSYLKRRPEITTPLASKNLSNNNEPDNPLTYAP